MIYVNIGERIKARRLELGLTADQLAECVGKNRATIYRYENGEIENMPLSVMEPLAKALGITPAELFGRSLGGDVSSSEFELIKKYRQLNASDKLEIRNMIDFKLFRYAQSSEEEESNCV